MSQTLPAADWILSRLHRASPESKGWDSFPLYPDDPLAPQQKRLDLYLRQAVPTMLNFWRIKPTDYPAGRDLFELALEETAQIVRAIVVRFLVWKHFEGDHIEKFEQLHREHGLDALLTAVRERIHRILPGSAVAGL